MYKTPFRFLLVLAALTILACKKDKVKAKVYTGPVESLVASYIQSYPQVTVNTTTTSGMPTEYGIIFKSSKKGFIRALGVRMPVLNGVYTVSLWDYDSVRLLRRYDATNVINTGFTYVDLEARGETLDILSNKKYMVSVYVKAGTQAEPWPYYYILHPSGTGSAMNFIPFTQGSLTCVGTQFTLAPAPAFPGTQVLHQDVINGLCDVQFRATEK